VYFYDTHCVRLRIAKPDNHEEEHAQNRATGNYSAPKGNPTIYSNL